MEKRNDYFGNGLSHHQMAAKGLVTATSATRDLVLLQDYGVTQETIDSLVEKSNFLEELKSFDTEKALNYLVTKEKIDARLVLTKALQSVKRKFALVYPKGSIIYSTYMAGNLFNGSFEKYANIAEKIVVGLVTFLPSLISVGITQETIDTLTTQLADYRALVTGKSDNLNMSKRATKVRQEAMSEVYQLIVTICEAGKAAWADADGISHYSEYIISR